MKLLIGLSVLCVSVFAGYYVFPECPCEWQLLIDYVKTEGGYVEWHNYQQVNGKFLKFEMTGLDPSFNDDRVYRSDLESDVIVRFRDAQYYGAKTRNYKYEDIKHFYRPVLVSQNDHYENVSFWYDNAGPGTFNDQACTVYSNSSTKEEFYVGSDGIPIGYKNLGQSFTATYRFKREAPLSLFVFERWRGFKDERCYTAPNASICPEQPSLSSSMHSQTQYSSSAGSTQDSSSGVPTQHSSLSTASASSSMGHSNHTFSFTSSSSSLSLSFLVFGVVSMIHLVYH